MDEYGIRIALEAQAETAVGELLDRLTECGEHVVARVKQKVPRRTGKLAASVDYRVDRQRLAVVIRVNQFYSAFLEFGFKHYGGWKKKGKSYTDVQRQFFAQAVEAELPAIEAILQGN